MDEIRFFASVIFDDNRDDQLVRPSESEKIHIKIAPRMAPKLLEFKHDSLRKLATKMNIFSFGDSNKKYLIEEIIF